MQLETQKYQDCASAGWSLKMEELSFKWLWNSCMENIFNFLISLEDRSKQDRDDFKFILQIETKHGSDLRTSAW